MLVFPRWCSCLTVATYFCLYLQSLMEADHVSSFFSPRVTSFCLVLCFNVNLLWASPKCAPLQGPDFFFYLIVFVVFVCFYHPSAVASYASLSSAHNPTIRLFCLFRGIVVLSGGSTFYKPDPHGNLANYAQWDTFKSCYTKRNSIHWPKSWVNVLEQCGKVSSFSLSWHCLIWHLGVKVGKLCVSLRSTRSLPWLVYSFCTTICVRQVLFFDTSFSRKSPPHEKYVTLHTTSHSFGIMSAHGQLVCICPEEIHMYYP